MSDSGDAGRARERAAVIFAVRSGQITAEEGARRLGVSRKTYYEWERRALEAMTGALEDKAAGRPAQGRKDQDRPTGGAPGTSGETRYDSRIRGATRQTVGTR